MARPDPPQSTDAAVARVRSHFDAEVDSEWSRLADTVEGRVSYEVHHRFLLRHLRPGDHVLEVGAGPGRFTRALAAAGARIEVTDLSEAQLTANRARADEEGYAPAVSDWQAVDVRDLSRYPDASFDLALAYGGPLSYVFDHAEDALRELLRVVRPDRCVLASVMCLLGAERAFLPGVMALSVEDNAHILATGDLRQTQPEGHVCQLYRSSEVADLVDAAGGQLLAMSASHWASLSHLGYLEQIEQDPVAWSTFLDLETQVAAQPGAHDGGTHILFACRRAG